MNPGLVVKLRPAGPWRIGPDSGARNRVDAVYHSDSLYSAVTSAMARLGRLEEWLDATARRTQGAAPGGAAPEVCFSSCFPFLDEIGFVIPPRTLWPPTSTAMLSARVRWKSARFIPLGLVQAMLDGQALHEDRWSVDSASQCLVPAGRSGPFRSSVRWSAAIDRFTGASERHSTACLEFRPGAGLWTVVSFRDETARERWADPVKAAFRWLADAGLGGERSRGWGRSDAPEFLEGTLPDMILPPKAPRAVAAEEPAGPPSAKELAPEPPAEALAVEPPPVEQPPAEPPAEPPVEEPPTVELADSGVAVPEVPSAEVLPVEIPATEASEEPAEASALEASIETPPAIELLVAPPAEEPAPDPPAAPAVSQRAHWLLSLFTPSPADSVDWSRGNYVVLARGGRVESPAGSGELKKQLQMVAEGSVVHAAPDLHGAATDVAPEGFAHPVFRAGFALAIPLPEVS
jgi:CRISPR type III-A-associated RAMP protein Csm4